MTHERAVRVLLYCGWVYCGVLRSAASGPVRMHRNDARPEGFGVPGNSCLL